MRAAAKPRDKRRWAAFCPDCHEIHELDRKRTEVNCSCGRRYKIDAGVVDYGRLTCRNCGRRDLPVPAGQLDASAVFIATI